MQLGTAQVLQIAETLGLQALEAGLPAMVMVAKLAQPGATDEQIEDYVSGEIKHTLRGKIGFAVDFVWSFIQPYIKSVIASTLASMSTPSSDQGTNGTHGEPA